MEKYVILLRGVNVGGKNILPMKELVSLFEEHGYLDVKTYIQSGNIIFSATNPSANSLASLINTSFGFTPKVIVLKEKEFRAAINNNPFEPESGNLAHLFFCDAEPKLNRQQLIRYKAESEQTKLIDRVLYLHTPDGIGRSKLVANIEVCLGVAATGRNLNTIGKLAQMLENS